MHEHVKHAGKERHSSCTLSSTRCPPESQLHRETHARALHESPLERPMYSSVVPLLIAFFSRQLSSQYLSMFSVRTLRFLNGAAAIWSSKESTSLSASSRPLHESLLVRSISVSVVLLFMAVMEWPSVWRALVGVAGGGVEVVNDKYFGSDWKQRIVRYDIRFSWHTLTTYRSTFTQSNLCLAGPTCLRLLTITN
jgi:hypothetical protein